MTTAASPDPRSAIIHGGGVAALTLARLLRIQGWRVRLMPAPRPRPAYLLIGDRTAGLLAALWRDDQVLAGGHAIVDRLVAWPAGADPVAAASPGIAIASEALVARLAARVPAAGAAEAVAWTIETRPGGRAPGDAAAPMQAFGARQAWLATARLNAAAPADRCLMEPVADGWLFVLPVGDGSASLQYVGVEPPPPQLVARSRLAAGAVAAAGGWSAPVAAMPRMSHAPARPGWLAVGEAALGFDPISGDGVGHALRSVVLAATELEAIAAGVPADERLAAYADTLRAAMKQHLKACLALYDNPPGGPDWSGEIAAMRAGPTAVGAPGRGSASDPT